jgi:DNA (cytosine-5)-methyltransferase 1
MLRKERTTIRRRSPKKRSPALKGRGRAASSCARRPAVHGCVVDLFCGAGGLSHGFKSEGFQIAAGVDVDENCRYPFEFNNRAPFVRADVSKLGADGIAKLFQPGLPAILVGCAPCQPFSIYNQKNSDPQWQLLTHFSRIISELKPDVVSMENVPSLVRFREGTVFKQFVENLKRDNYHVMWKVVHAASYGVPQTRSRLVLLASRLGPIDLVRPGYSKNTYVTVRNAIGRLPPLAAGEADKVDPLHCCSRLAPINMRRMRASKPGGSWKDWNDGLVTKCHRRASGRGYASVYGRMSWSAPSPTITTQFFGFGNGRFGHPSQDRALSLREGAILQSFPRDYRFVAPGKQVHLKSIGRMIGNAVPVELGRAIAKSIKRHLREQK